MANLINILALYEFKILHRSKQRHANAYVLLSHPYSVVSVILKYQWFNFDLKNKLWKQQVRDAIKSTLIQ